jgi:hypothetical protein
MVILSVAARKGLDQGILLSVAAGFNTIMCGKEEKRPISK